MSGTTQQLAETWPVLPFAGKSLRAIEHDEIVLLENLHYAGGRMGRHSHNTAFVSLVFAGRYLEKIGTGVIRLDPGSAGFYPPGTEHSVQIGARDVHCLTIEISGSHCARLEEIGGMPDVFVERNGMLAWLAGRLYEELCNRAPASSLIVEGLVLEMLGTCVQSSCPSHDRREPAWLRTVEEIVRAEFGERLTVNDIAARVGVHPVHLSRTWRRFRGCSLGTAVNRARVEAACRLIDAGEPSLATIALDSGFADQTHFSRVFKVVTGLTPGTYRARRQTA